MRRIICTVAVLSLFAGFPMRAAAQPVPSGGPRGFHIGMSLALHGARLDGGAEAIYAGVGSPSVGLGYGLELGYDARRFGASLGLELGAVALDVAEREGAVVMSFTLLAHWRTRSAWWGGFRPVITAGVVRQAFGLVEVPTADIPPEGQPLASTGEQTWLTLVGNGARVGVGAERPLGRFFGVSAGASLDLVRYGVLLFDEGEVSRREPGLSVLPRLSFGLRWWPFGAGR
jgi:hypothetical protein